MLSPVMHQRIVMEVLAVSKSNTKRLKKNIKYLNYFCHMKYNDASLPKVNRFPSLTF